MTTKAKQLNPELETAIKGLLRGIKGKPFEEQKTILELAMKFEALKLKAKSEEWGKGFDNVEGAEDEPFG